MLRSVQTLNNNHRILFASPRIDMPSLKISLIILCISAFLSGCQSSEITEIYQKLPFSLGGVTNNVGNKIVEESPQKSLESEDREHLVSESLVSLINQSLPSIDVD